MDPVSLSALTAPGQNVVFEAEQFASRSEGGSHTWWNVSAERAAAGVMFGAASPYLQALSAAGAETASVNVAPDAPYVDYVIQVSQAGHYALDLKAAARSGGGSVWARFEGAYASDAQGRAVNASALHVPIGTSGFFNWIDAGVWDLPAGTFTLRVSMRESGAALDALRIERVSATTPPTDPPTTPTDPPTTPTDPPITPTDPPTTNPPFALGVFEAAAFHARTAGEGHQWAALSGDAQSAGALVGSSGGLVQALNAAGADSDLANVNPGAPYVDYRVNVPTAGRYALDLRSAGRNGSSSVFARVVDAYAVDVQGLGVNSSSLLMSAGTDGAFAWRDAGIWDLTAGEHTIRLWMRESGAAVDALRLEAASTTPPTEQPTDPPITDPPTTDPPITTTPGTIVGSAPVTIEAEAFHARQADQGRQWWIVDAERASVGSYFGAGGPAADFLQSLSDGGVTGSLGDPVGAFVDYRIDVATAGTYAVDLRVAGRSATQSLYFRVLDAYAVDAQGLDVNASALVVRTNSSGFFAWQDAGIWQLTAGQHTLRLWMREPGAALDALRISAADPPIEPPISSPAHELGEIQAEAFQNRQEAQGHVWWKVDAERSSSGPFIGATGTSGDFVQALALDAQDSDAAFASQAGPYLDYVVNVPADGRYDLDVRVAGRIGGKTLLVRVLDAQAINSQSLQPFAGALTVQATDSGSFAWQDAGIWQLKAGQRTIRVWMGESGVALDALQLAAVSVPEPSSSNFGLGLFQAESFQRRVTAVAHQWFVADSERSATGIFRGASGPSHDFLQPLTTTGFDSTYVAASDVGPYVEYDIEIPHTGRYALGLNLAGTADGDAVWARFTSASAANTQGHAVSGGALLVAADSSKTFAWKPAGIWDLPAGKATLRIGMNAAGAALDALRLEPFSLFLPGATADGQWLQFRGDGALSGHTGLIGDIDDPSIAWSLDISGRETLAAFEFGGSGQTLPLPAAAGIDRTDLIDQLWGLGGARDSLDGDPRWWLVGRETDSVATLRDEQGLPATYLQALSDQGILSGPAATRARAAYVDYVLAVPSAGVYQLQLDVAGLDADHNGLGVYVMEATLLESQGAATVGGRLTIDAATDRVFHSTNAGLWSVSAGAATVRVSLHELGAALRGLRLIDQGGQVMASAAASDIAARSPGPVSHDLPTQGSDYDRIGDFLPNVPGLERLTHEQLNPAADGVVRLYRREAGQWVQAWQTPVITRLGVQPNLITGDFDQDGTLEAAFAAWDDLYVLDLANGQVEHQVRFTASEAATGRPYGWLGAHDLNGDGKDEFVILADFENNLSVVGWNGNGQLAKLWDHTIEPDIVEKETIHATPFDPLHDINGDGVVDVVTSIFNETGDNRWHVVARDGMTGTPLADLAGRYYWGGADVDADGRTELFVSQIDSGAVLPASAPLSVLEHQPDGSLQVRWQQAAGQFQMQSVPLHPDAMNAGGAAARLRLLVGELASGGPLTFFTRQTLDAATQETQVVAWQSGDAGIQAIGSLAGPRLEVLAVAAAPGEPSLLVRASTASNEPAAITAVGFQGEALQSRRTGATLTSVVVGQLGPGEQPTVVLQTPFEQLTAFQVSVGGATDTLWTQPGRGGYVGQSPMTGQLGFGNVALADLLGDGNLATLVGRRGAAGQAQMAAIGNDGQTLWSHDFNHIPGAPPEWNVGGLTAWMAGNFRSTEFMDVMVTLRRGTMHSDELYLLDGRTGEVVWQRDYGHSPGSPFLTRGAGGAQMAVVDWDGDGLDEAVNVFPDAFYVVDGNGQNLVDRSFMDDVYGPNPTQQGFPIIADFLANGSQTILHASSEYVLALLDPSANSLWHTAFGVKRTLWSPAIGDFDGDHDLDVLSSERDSHRLNAYDARTGAVQWSLDLPGVAGPAVSGDLDGDGRDEALFAIGNVLYCIGTTLDGSAGQIEWTRSFDSDLGMPILGDVTGLGQLQIVVVSQNGHVYGLA